MPDSINVAVAEFARGILRYVEDGNVVEVHECGFVNELKRVMQEGGMTGEDCCLCKYPILTADETDEGNYGKCHKNCQDS